MANPLTNLINQVIELRWSTPQVLGYGNGKGGIANYMDTFYPVWNHNNTVYIAEFKKKLKGISKVESAYYPDAVYYGGLHVVYEKKADTLGYSVFYHAPDGSEKKISKTKEYSELPQIACGGGKLHVVFQSKDVQSGSIYYVQSEDNGQTWSSPQFLGHGFYPRLTCDSGGNPHVVWNAASPYGVRYRKMVNGNWWDIQEIANGNKQQTPDIAISKSDDIMITYSRYTDFETEVWFNGKKITLKDSLVYSLWSRVEVDCRGRFHIVFQGKRVTSDTWDVYHRVFDSGKWYKPKMISGLTSQEQSPTISLSDSSAAILCMDGVNALLSRCRLSC